MKRSSRDFPYSALFFFKEKTILLLGKARCNCRFLGFILGGEEEKKIRENEEMKRKNRRREICRKKRGKKGEKGVDFSPFFVFGLGGRGNNHVIKCGAIYGNYNRSYLTTNRKWISSFLHEYRTIYKTYLNWASGK